MEVQFPGNPTAITLRSKTRTETYLCIAVFRFLAKCKTTYARVLFHFASKKGVTSD